MCNSVLIIEIPLTFWGREIGVSDAVCSNTFTYDVIVKGWYISLINYSNTDLFR